MAYSSCGLIHLSIAHQAISWWPRKHLRTSKHSQENVGTESMNYRPTRDERASVLLYLGVAVPSGAVSATDFSQNPKRGQIANPRHGKVHNNYSVGQERSPTAQIGYPRVSPLNPTC